MDGIVAQLRRNATPGRLGVIVGVPLLLAAGFAGAAGWFSPGRLSGEDIVDTLHGADGVHPGFRANHAKGMCVSGSFVASGDGARLTRASLLRAGVRSKVIGRVSLGGGMPFQPDAPGKVRALALLIAGPDGTQWRTAMVDLPVFPARDPATFNGLLKATAPDPATHKPDPAKAGPFIGAHPETAAALGLIKAHTPSSGFADDTFRSLDSFTFTDAAGHATAVRWSFVPALPPDAPAGTAKGDDYLFDDLATALAHGKLHWTLVLQAAGPGDDTADPTRPWPDDRPRIEAGTLTLDEASSEDAPRPDGGACTDINYDPTILPDGIAPSDDPFPAARSATYAVSFRLREGAAKPASALTPSAIAQAGETK